MLLSKHLYSSDYRGEKVTKKACVVSGPEVGVKLIECNKMVNNSNRWRNSMSTLEEIKQNSVEEGKAVGKAEDKKEIALRMLKHGMDVNTIQTITELPLEEVEKQKKQQN